MFHPTARLLFRAALVVAALSAPVAAQQGPMPAPDTITADEAHRVAIEALKRALTLAGREDWVFARAEAKAAGPVAVDIIEWHRLRAGAGTFDDYRAFATRHADWPGMDLLRRRAESTLTEAPAAKVVAWFAGAMPQTGQGALTLIAALQSEGRHAEARQAARNVWRSLKLTEAEETAFLARYGDLVAPYHADRAQAMLDRGETAQAQRLVPLLQPGPGALTSARVALQRRMGGVDRLINEIPEGMRNSAGLDRDRTVWRWRNSMEDGAADILLDRSTDAQNLGDPAIWATVRGQLARFYLRKGDPRLAYKIAARHRMQPGGGDWADLEWLAGYAALKLGDAPVALEHFTHVADHVRSPISTARAAYWQGRALEVIGRVGEAREAFRQGARWQTAYYGLLSAERLDLPLDPAFSQPTVLPDWHDAAFTLSDVHQAALMLHEAGAQDLARRFLLHLEESQPADQIPPMAALAEDWDDAYLALSLAKRAANAGDVLVSAYYPIPALTTDDLGVPEELALSIARRESEFDHTVVSHAGARGLMQLMPGTAQLMAPVIGEPYEAARLTSDPTYNARLGGAYLAKLRAEFGTSPVLVAAGYNAGPGRSRRWIAEQGDPRLPDVDVVDWVEMIPFTETRNYVMRVAESLPVYRARLGLPDQGPVRFTEELRGTPPAIEADTQPPPETVVPTGAPAPQAPLSPSAP
ncbi:lytic transglycosylase domain-containing protein [Sinirhodobacter populi]|uniref:Lytic transglycosylase domain-containing protein n=2 Tax=Paenirhodobacter populi TaxID=2306993 RepID=A0A443KJU3_9RHOB|nr:lytic transglycosylase domain-containing protein [Sinirhodobacter populi]